MGLARVRSRSKRSFSQRAGTEGEELLRHTVHDPGVEALGSVPNLITVNFRSRISASFGSSISLRPAWQTSKSRNRT